MNTKNLTLDQAELLFRLFLAQNADKKVSEFVNSAENCHSGGIDDTLGSLSVEIGEEWLYVGDVFWFDTDGSFEVCHYNGGAHWEHFDIMKHISLEDKI